MLAGDFPDHRALLRQITGDTDDVLIDDRAAVIDALEPAPITLTPRHSARCSFWVCSTTSQVVQPAQNALEVAKHPGRNQSAGTASWGVVSWAAED